VDPGFPGAATSPDPVLRPGDRSTGLRVVAGRWTNEEAGLVEPSFPQPQVAAWTVRLWLAPRPKPYRLVPFVLKNWRTPFSDMHVTGLWVLPGP